MDPFTQGVLGAVAAQAVAKGFSRASSTASTADSSSNSTVAVAGVLGFFAGMAADLDVLIRFKADPLLFLEYHRQFSHSLLFIPLGGLICGFVLHFLFARKRGLTLRKTSLFCTVAYATHALLDACTSYGTQLFWPFSNTRIAWNSVSIIDPLFTLPIFICVILAARKSQPYYGRIALVWALVYLSVGAVQRDRALDLGWQLAMQRGHVPEGLVAKPSFANLIVWKTVYETADRFYVDAVRVALTNKIYDGESIRKLDIEKDLPWLDHGSQQALDIERFRWFSNGFIATDPDHVNRIVDIRYSMVANQIKPLWSIQLSPQAAYSQHALYVTTRARKNKNNEAFWSMLFDLDD